MKKLPRATERKKKYPQIKKKIYIYMDPICFIKIN